MRNLSLFRIQFLIKGVVSKGLTFFGQNQATIPLLIYKIILKNQEKEINQFLRKEQIMVCSCPFWKQKCENLKQLG